MAIKNYFQLTKFGIIVFVLLTGLAGYGISYNPVQDYDFFHVILLIIGLYFLSSGSFALNQTQEWKLDSLMPRTQKRPIPSGLVAPWQGFLIGILAVVCGSFLLYLLNPTTCYLGLATVVLYNGMYTMYWKKHWAFGAVPGAIPGAMPVVIGYSANNPSVINPECFYLFLIMFFWQMPHFWALAIRYKEDYEKGGFPVLPAIIGVPKTLYQIGLYTFAYVAIAVASPWFVHAHLVYCLIVLPFACLVMYQFAKYYQSGGRKKWLGFFLTTNFSMLAFVAAPVVDKWIYLITNQTF